MEASPVEGPIVFVVVRGAVVWGIYQLWREEMNWPFHSETPLSQETARIGVSLAFPR